MDTHAYVKGVFAAVLHEVFVGTDTSSFECFTRELFVFIGDEMDAERKLVDTRSFAAQVKDTNLGIRNTTAKTRFWLEGERTMNDRRRTARVLT